MREDWNETERLDVGCNAHPSSRVRLDKVPGQELSLGLPDARVLSKHLARQAGHVRQLHGTTCPWPGQGIQPAAYARAQRGQMVGKRPKTFKVNEAANTRWPDTCVQAGKVGAHAMGH
ncbi:hypothetical protein D9M71_716430 [compost metagenome]